MKTIAFGFLCGVLVLQGMQELPAILWCWMTPGCLYSIIRFPQVKVLFAAGAGFLWALLFAHIYLAPELDEALQGVDLELTGTVASIPVQMQRSTRFLFDIKGFSGHEDASIPDRIRLHWYQNAPNELRPGQYWRLIVRLKRPHGFSNPGGFDYEAWLFRQGIRATGYVREDDANQLLRHSSFSRPLDQIRHRIADLIKQHSDEQHYGILTALTIGERQSLNEDKWDLLLATGTNHLLAISGLHIGMIAGMVYIMMLHLWRLSASLCLRYPAQRAAAVAAILSGCMYAALAGFSIPTQRALIMLVVFMAAILIGRALRPAHSWWLALLAVLICNPLSVLSPGFWLSFLAVAVLLIVFIGRPVRQSTWKSWGRVQWVLAIGLIPLTLLIFSRVSLVMPVANLLAVPWVGFIVLPLSLIGTSLVASSMPGGELILGIAGQALNVLWYFLEILSLLPYAQWFHAPPIWTALPATLGVLLLLAPRGWPARWLGLVLLIPVATARIEDIDKGAVRIALLDVGQGLSMVVQTHSHALVYDTGAKFSDQFDAGEAVVLPYLRQAGIRAVDTLVISHEDNDHAGGAGSLLQGIRVNQILTSAPAELDNLAASQCLAGDSWQWDGVKFVILHPDKDWKSSANNRSCVLRVSNSAASMLITGDIQASAEQHLLQRYGEDLNSELLLVPHHGSKTSSTHSLLDYVNPKWALVATGYHNRWNFPRSQVLQRYQSRGIEVLNTAQTGTIRFDVSPAQGITSVNTYRQYRKRYWSTPR